MQHRKRYFDIQYLVLRTAPTTITTTVTKEDTPHPSHTHTHPSPLTFLPLQSKPPLPLNPASHTTHNSIHPPPFRYFHDLCLLTASRSGRKRCHNKDITLPAWLALRALTDYSSRKSRHPREAGRHEGEAAPDRITVISAMNSDDPHITLAICEICDKVSIIHWGSVNSGSG